MAVAVTAISPAQAFSTETIYHVAKLTPDPYEKLKLLYLSYSGGNVDATYDLAQLLLDFGRRDEAEKIYWKYLEMRNLAHDQKPVGNRWWNPVILEDFAQFFLSLNKYQVVRDLYQDQLKIAYNAETIQAVPGLDLLAWNYPSLLLALGDFEAYVNLEGTRFFVTLPIPTEAITELIKTHVAPIRIPLMPLSICGDMAQGPRKRTIRVIIDDKKYPYSDDQIKRWIEGANTILNHGTNGILGVTLDNNISHKPLSTVAGLSTETRLGFFYSPDIYPSLGKEFLLYIGPQPEYLRERSYAESYIFGNLGFGVINFAFTPQELFKGHIPDYAVSAMLVHEVLHSWDTADFMEPLPPKEYLRAIPLNDAFSILRKRGYHFKELSKDNLDSGFPTIETRNTGILDINWERLMTAIYGKGVDLRVIKQPLPVLVRDLLSQPQTKTSAHLEFLFTPFLLGRGFFAGPANNQRQLDQAS
jgi:hypothetical protein